MNRSLLTSAALAALIAAPAVAQQTGTSPNSPGTSPGMQQPGTTTAPLGTSPSNSAMPMAEMTADDLQGMTVYTTKIDVANSTTVTGSTTTGTGSTATTGSTTGTTGTAGTAGTMGSTGTTGTAGTSGMAGNTGSMTVPNTADNRPMTRDELKALTDRARSIGEVNDLLIGPDGRVQQAIIDVGGFLGVGERPVTVSWQDLKIVRTNDGDMVAFIERSRAELNALPQYRAPARR